MVRKHQGKTKSGLTRESITAAAMKIVDEAGYEALSMRRLGAMLGVDPMAVYYHIPNKSALLDGLVDLVMSEIDLSLDDPAKTTEERLLLAAHVYRQVLLAHPNALRVLAVRAPATPAAFRPVELLLGIFLDAGFSAADALAGVNIFARFVRGAVLVEVQQMQAQTQEGQDACGGIEPWSLPADEFPCFNRVMNEAAPFTCDDEFDRGARALIRGLLEDNKPTQGE